MTQTARVLEAVWVEAIDRKATSETPVFDSLYREFERSKRLDECVGLILRRISPGLHKCSHGGLRGFCRGNV